MTTASRRRSLLRDVADGLAQQMFFWGCDARHPAGNLLVRIGLERRPRADSGGEGSSRYRAAWRGGVIELHGFCAGWYPAAGSGPGVVFIRHRGRLGLVQPGEPLTPGRYESGRMTGAAPDDVMAACRPLLEWIVQAEHRATAEVGAAHRAACWRLRRSLPAEGRWLEPTEAVAWFEAFIRDPANTPRARTGWRERSAPSLREGGRQNPQPGPRLAAAA